MSVMDEIRKLDEKKAALLSAAKEEALNAANAAIATLNELGFSYRLTSDAAPARRATAAGGERRTGQRDAVLGVVKAAANGISAADVLTKMNAGSDTEKTSIRNALAALKRNGNVDLKDGTYTAK